jgi:hypothetical protein
MASPTSKLVLGAFVLTLSAAPALADGASAYYYGTYYDYGSRSDGIAISAGDASAANLAIQTPTPWPPYVNDVNIPGIGRHGVAIIDNFYKKYDAQQQGTASTIINIGQ